MDSNSYQSLEEAYQSILDSQKDVENLDENITGASLGFKVPLGRGVNRTSGIGAGVQGGSGTTKGSANASITRTTDRVQRTPAKTAVDNALSNLKTGAAIPKTKQLPDKIGGSFNANLSGGSAPKPKPAAAKPKPKPNKTNTTPRPTDKAVTPPPTGGRPIPPTTPTTPRVANTTPTTPRVANTTTPTRRSGAAALGGGMSIARGGGARGMMSMDTMSDVDTYNLVLEYLLDEGFASTEQSADKIILNMSEAWFEEIMEKKNPEIEERGKKVAELEREGRAKGITDKFRKEHPGSREEKKERGRKPTEGELTQERIKKHNERVAKHGFTKKEKKESQARAKYDSARD